MPAILKTLPAPTSRIRCRISSLSRIPRVPPLQMCLHNLRGVLLTYRLNSAQNAATRLCPVQISAQDVVPASPQIKAPQIPGGHSAFSAALALPGCTPSPHSEKKGEPNGSPFYMRKGFRHSRMFSMLDTSDTCFFQHLCFITLVQNESPNLLNFLYIHCILLTNYHKKCNNKICIFI